MKFRRAGRDKQEKKPASAFSVCFPSFKSHILLQSASFARFISGFRLSFSDLNIGAVQEDFRKMV